MIQIAIPRLVIGQQKIQEGATHIKLCFKSSVPHGITELVFFHNYKLESFRLRIEIMYKKPLAGEKKHYHSGMQTVAQMSPKISVTVN